MVPTAGEKLSGRPSGTQNSNDVGPTSAILPANHFYPVLCLDRSSPRSVGLKKVEDTCMLASFYIS